MEEKEFVALVDELEDFAHRNPGEYKLRVALLAALGYVFLIGSVITFCCSLALSFTSAG